MDAPVLTVGGQRIPCEPDGLPAGMPWDYNVQTLALGVLPWAEDMLAQPDGDRVGDGWKWTDTQARLVSWWYALTPGRSGRFLFRRGQIVLCKGAGKSPLAAALSCCALGAPVVFDGFDSAGDAVGKPHPSPHVQLAAVSQDQADNTMSLVLAMLREGNAYRNIKGLDLGLSRIRTRNGRLEPVTASAPSREGQRLTDAIIDEPHLMTPSNGGVRLAGALRRNLGKMGGRALETTNAWVPGEESVAESTDAYAQKIREGKAVDAGLMQYHPKVHVEDLADSVEVRAALATLYADSPWVDIDRILAEIVDMSNHPSDSRKYFLNEVSSADDAWLVQHEWAGCSAPDTVVAEREHITLGFDGSRARSYGVTDATALIGCRVSDGHLFELGVWEQPDGPAGRDWQVPTFEVDAAVRAAFSKYVVLGFYCDPARWETYVADWEARYGPKLRVKATVKNPCEWWMTGGTIKKTIQALDQFHSAVVDQELSHDGSFTLTRHVLNARRRIKPQGVSIAKEHPESIRKIDAAVAAVLAWQARLDARSKGFGNSKRRTQRAGVGF